MKILFAKCLPFFFLNQVYAFLILILYLFIQLEIKKSINFQQTIYTFQK